MARRKRHYEAESPPAPEADEVTPPEIEDAESPVIEPPDIDFADVPEAESEAVAVVENPAEPVPSEPPASSYRDVKLARYLEKEAAARDAGNDGLAAHYRTRYTKLKGA